MFKVELDTIVTAYFFRLVDKELTLGSKGGYVMAFVDRTRQSGQERILNENSQSSAFCSERKEKPP